MTNQTNSPETILIKDLTTAAKKASKNAYAPYSAFRVGAAVLTENDEIFTGVNIENASYGLTVCAERNAIFHAVGAGARRIKALVVYTATCTPTPPCGACRQVINEFGSHADIYSVCDSGEYLHHSLTTLLPQAFGPANLRTLQGHCSQHHDKHASDQGSRCTDSGYQGVADT